MSMPSTPTKLTRKDKQTKSNGCYSMTEKTSPECVPEQATAAKSEPEKTNPVCVPGQATEAKGEPEKTSRECVPEQATEAKSEPEKSCELTWSLFMDGILPVHPSPLSPNPNGSSFKGKLSVNEEKMTELVKTVDAKINSVLYGPKKTRRLSVFEEICKE